MKHNLLMVNLNLFEGEATGETSTPAAEGNTGDLSNVVFGKQEEESTPEPEETTEGDTDLQESKPTIEERRKAYDEFINSADYKEFYTADTQKMINRRFKQTKDLERQIADYKPLLDMLNQRYGTSDLNAAMKALENDNAYWENAADEAGMTVEQYKRVSRLERENKALLESQQQFEQTQAIDNQVQTWIKEAEEMKAMYPDFNLEAELENEHFQRLLTSEVPMQFAYEVLHMNEIKTNISKTAAQTTEKNVVDNIRAKGSRPVENGTSSKGSFTVRNDVTKLTKEERAEIARRAARGEIIRF